MSALRCLSCETPLTDETPFCGACGKPTTFASYEEKTAWEVSQWRAYSGDRPKAPIRAPSPIDLLDDEPAWQRRQRERAERIAAAERVAAQAAAEAARAAEAGRVAAEAAAEEEPEPIAAERVSPLSLSPTPPSIAPAEPQPGNDDRPSTYRRCMNCGTSDWVLRVGRNDDATWRYWCVRCARSFRTDVRLRQAFKPWLISAAVIAAIAIGTARFA